MPPKVFISYAHEDRAWCDKLEQHLGGLKHQGRLAVWADDQIMAGSEWDPAIRRELDEAAIIVLIVSPAFLGSAFCQTVELERAIERHGQGTATVIPIIADHCHWTSSPIEKLQARPQDEQRNLKPLVDWPNANVPLAAIARDIDKLTRPRGLADAATPFEPAPQPLHLPKRRRTFFVGRDREKADLAERLAGGGRAAICAVAGMGGVGKTELALQVAAALGRDAFPDGILTVDLMGTPDATTTLPPLSPEAAMRDVLTRLDATAKPPEEPAALHDAYARALAGKRLLLILDNARDAAQVRPLLPPEPVALLVTSRTRIDLPEGLTLDLDTLAPDDARALLKEEIGAVRALDDATLDRFAALCGYLPVALLAIAGTIKKSKSRTPDQLLARLEADRANGLTSVLDRLRPSVEALAEDDPELARRFARLAVFAGDFAAAAAAHVWETDDETTHDGLDALLARSLLLLATRDTDSAPRFRLHDLIRELAAERLDDDGQNVPLRHATYFKDMLSRCKALYLAGNAGILEGLALFDRERAEIMAGQAWATAQDPADEEAARLAADYPNAGIYVIELRLDSRSQIAWLEAALAASRRLGDRGREGAALGNLGLAWADLGETRKAIEHHEQDLAIRREIRDRRGEGNALNNLGLAWADLGETRKAIELYEQRLAIAREIGDRRGEGDGLGNLGLAWAALGEPKKAVEHHEQALVISREIGDRRGEGSDLGNLGLAWAALGEPRKAIELYEQRLAIAREIGDRRGEGNGLGNLGLAWADLGEPRKTIDFYDQQLVITREIGDRRGEGNALWNAALAHEELSETPAALDKAKAAYVIYRAIEDPNAAMVATWLRKRGVDPDSL